MKTLIVEDDYGCALSLKLMLPEGEHVIAGTINDAVSALKVDTFDIVFLDLNLPDSNPSATIQTISAIRELAGKAVVVVATGHPSYLLDVRPYFPEDLILQKPFDSFGVARVLREVRNVKARRTLIGDVRSRAMMLLGALTMRTALMALVAGLYGCATRTEIHAKHVTLHVSPTVSTNIKATPLP